MYNVADALTSVPLLFAFLLGRAATRVYTYGFGRAEDLDCHPGAYHHAHLSHQRRLLTADRG